MQEQPVAIVQTLKDLGLTVEAHDDDGEIYTVSRGEDAALLDLTSFESMHDSIRTIQAAFDLDVNLDHEGNPLMSQRTSDTRLAQRVASIGDSKHPLATATVASRGRTFHRPVKITDGRLQVEPCFDVLLTEFVRGSGPLTVQSKTIVNADELRDLVVAGVLK